MDEIVLGGSKYITSVKAAKIVGYSSDYISRLCRTGRLKGHLAGRVWFVELASLWRTFPQQPTSRLDYEGAPVRLGDNLAPLRYENDSGPVPHPLAARTAVGEIAEDEPLSVAGPDPAPSTSTSRWILAPIALVLSLTALASVFVTSVEKYPGVAHAEERTVSERLALVWPFDSERIGMALGKAGQTISDGVSAVRLAWHDTFTVALSFSADISRAVAALLPDLHFDSSGTIAVAGDIRETAGSVAVPIYCSISELFDLSSCAEEASQSAPSYAKFPEAALARDRLLAGQIAPTTPGSAQDVTATGATGPESSAAIITYVTNQPVIERIVERVVASAGVTEDYLASKLNELSNSLKAQIYGISAAPSNNFSSVSQAIALSNKIDQLSGVTISNATVSGVSGLTNADIPDDITASSYLPLAGGTLTGALAGTDLTLSGNLTVSGAQTLSGAITIPYLSATSTTASSFIQASTTRLSVFDTAYFGGTSTTTISSIGSITLPATALLTAPYASSTAITVSGTGYFGTASTTNLIVSSLTAGRVPYVTTNGAFTDSSALTFTGTVLSAPQLLATGSTTLQSFTATNTTTTNATTTNFFATVASSTNAFGTVANFGTLTTGALTLTGVTGSLQAVSGALSATSTLSVAYGGTGTSSPYQFLYGNGSALVSTSTIAQNFLDPLVILSSEIDTSLELAGILGDETGTGVAVFGTSPTFTTQITTPIIVANSTTGTSTVAGGLAIETSGLVYDYSTNRVGIGTAAPSQKLQISSGNILLDDDQFLLWGGGNNGITGNASVNALAFYTNGTEKIRLDSSGNVGIGTTNPIANTGYRTLTIAGTSGGVIELATSTTFFGRLYSQNSDMAIYLSNYVEGPIIFSTSNAERSRITSTGNLGIGTTTPSSKLQVYSGNSTSGIGLRSGSASQYAAITVGRTTDEGFFTVSGSADQWFSGAVAGDIGLTTAGSGGKLHLSALSGTSVPNLSLNTSGNVGIGTTNPGELLDLRLDQNATSSIRIRNATAGANSSARIVLGNSSDAQDGFIQLNDNSNTTLGGARSLNILANAGPITFLNGYSTLSERMRITSTGNVGIATTTPWRTLSVSGTVGLSSSLTSGTTGNYLCINTSTYEVTSGTTCSASSQRFKENIADLSYGLEEILKLRPVTFTYKPEVGAGTSTRLGLIAEEVLPVIPEVVTLDKEGQPEAVVYESLVSLALQGIKEMWAALVDLKDKVATVLERLAGHDEEIAALKSRVTQLEAQLGAAPAAAQESVGGGAVDDGEQGSTAQDTEAPAIGAQETSEAI
jgi:hypothetical protein